MIYTCLIKNIVDGDTVLIDIKLGFNIVLTNIKVRILGIDTPESRTTDLSERKQGLLSKQKLLEKLPLGTEQILLTEETMDKYGRVLGDFKLGDDVMSNWLIINNYAVSYHGENKETVKSSHLTNRQILIDRGELSF